MCNYFSRTKSFLALFFLCASGIQAQSNATGHSAPQVKADKSSTPVITMVSPNPLPPGSGTIAVTGTGFSTSANIWIGNVQYSSAQAVAGTLTASYYIAPGTTSVVVTVNNGGLASAPVTVPVGNNATPTTPTTPATTYALTVVNGTGSGSYTAGSVVNISANPAPSGQQFQSWTGAAVASATSPSTTITMPAANTTITAGYTGGTPGLSITSVSPNPVPQGSPTITVTGTGFAAGAAIWVGSVQYSSAQPTANTLTTTPYIAPGTASIVVTVHSNGSISAPFTVPVSGPPTYTLTVIGGSGSGAYLAGANVIVSANEPPAGQAFSGWTGAAVATSSAAATTLIMPAANTTLTANFASGPVYPLTVNGGQGSGNYPAGAAVAIAANAPPAGQSFINWTGAAVASPNSPATTLAMPAAAATVTANFTQPAYTLTVVNGTGSGSYAAGKVVSISANTPPAGQYFQSWTGPGLTGASPISTTITMPAANTTVTANFYTPLPIPYPVSSHPRLWVTPADLPRLQSWATSSNQIYAAQKSVLFGAIGNYNACFPGAGLSAKNPTPANPYCDFGDTQGYTGVLSEENAMVLAFNSLIDPSLSNRQQYAQAARNLIMYALNQAAQGHLTNAPFRDPIFSIYNRASFTGLDWPLVVDWIYNATDAAGNAILTAADKAVVQNVFLQWCGDDYGLADAYGNPEPIGIFNTPALVPFRVASNNYYLAHARNLTMMALALDPADDPAVSPQLPPNTIGNSVRSYLLDATGAWLYQIYGMMGDPAAVAAAYGISNNPKGAGLGLASGGLPPEGFLYGESFGYTLGQLLALQTAGFNNPALAGPQIAMIGAPVWDRYVTGFLSSLTPAAQVPPSATYYGPVYQFAGYGDMLREYVTPDFMRPFALLELLEQENGSTQHQNAARWFVTNAPTGGAATLMSRVTDPWTWGVMDSTLAFLMFDPAAPAPTDPRPGYPTLFYDAPAGRVVAHSDWTPNGTMFDYKASWQSINHQNATGGQFELYRKGEWLTKEMSNYDNNAQGITTLYHNTLALQNWSPNGAPSAPALGWNEGTEWTNGSQWMWGASSGDPTTISSSGPGYVYAASDLTKMYNRPSDAMDVTQATRSILWLNNLAGSDYVVVYDRAATKHSGLFKKFNMSLVNPPVTQNANGVTVTTETMNSGQQLFIQTLLPVNAAASYFNGAAQLAPIAELEPTRYIYQVQDPTSPATTRFLHVLQGADAGTGMAASTYLQSSAGTAFDGAQFGAAEVWFPVSSPTAFAGATLPAPTGVHTALITGLSPNTGYSVSVQSIAGGNTIVISPGGSTLTADAGGVLLVTF
jgi:hypothetical protein